jgi:hypothetical protein
MALCWQWDKL